MNKKDVIYKLKEYEKERVSILFKDWEETLIWSCLQNIMGNIYVDNIYCPESAMAMLGDFCFFAGKVNQHLILYKPEDCKQNFMIMVPQNEEWEKMIEKCYKENAHKVVRYAFKKEEDIFDRKKLKQIVENLPSEYQIRKVDASLFMQCKNIDWCKDFVSQYNSYAEYNKYGAGILILHNGIIVSGASSYSGFINGIEIEVDTKEEYRRKGLASVASAALILECLKRGWYPSWDAQNKWSVGLALKLGYKYSHEYVAYEIYPISGISI